MLICTCDVCRFIFSPAQIVRQCPDCGSFAVRPACASEAADFFRYRREIEAEDRAEAARRMAPSRGAHIANPDQMPRRRRRACP